MSNETVRNLVDDVDYVLIDEETLQARIAEIAAEIEKLYEGEPDLMLVCVLKGSYLFLADLSRALQRPHSVDFMAVSSYGAGTTSSGAVQILMDLKTPIADRNVLIVEDIIDSGRTLEYLRRTLEARSPRSLKIVTLLDKPSRREIDVPVEYVGFDVPDEFVVGYGLDFNEEYRNLPYIAVLKPHVFAHLFEE